MTSSRVSTPTPRNPVIASKPTWDLTKSWPRNITDSCCPAAGHPNILRNRPQAVSIVRHFLETGKPIAANCHGPLLLFAAGNMKERTMTCYPDLEPDVRNRGSRVRESRSRR